MVLLRNTNLDLLKFISAFAVVCIHTTYFGSTFVKPIARFAVPCFFIISGFFLYKNSIDSIKRKIRKTIFLLLWTNILYGIFYYRFQVSNDISVSYMTDILHFILLCYNPIAPHLWYITAYVYVLLVLYFIVRYNLWNIFFYVIPILLIANLVIGAYSEFVFQEELPLKYVRNAWLVGLPFVCIGALIRRYLTFVRKLNFYFIFFIGILCCFLTEIEAFVVVGNTTKDLYASTIYYQFAFLSVFNIYK